MKKREGNKHFIFVSSRTRLHDCYWICASALANIYCSLVCFVLKKKSGKRGTDAKHSVAICAIFKNESLVLSEWISYHLSIGISHFYLYNNNSTDEFREILEPYIADGVVTCIDWPYDKAQIPVYNDCYKKYSKSCDWLTFIDLDEFVVMKEENSIVDFLNNYRDYPGVMVYWKMFGTSGKIEHDREKLVSEQYFMSWDKYYEYGKMFYNMQFELATLGKTMHHYGMGYKTLFGYKLKILPVNDSKHFLLPFYLSHGSKPSKSSIQINHYWSKSFGLYTNKQVNGRPDDAENNFITDALFWRFEHWNRVPDFSIYRFLVKTKLNMKKYISSK